MKPRTPGIWLIVATVGLLALQPVRGYSQSQPPRPVKPQTPVEQKLAAQKGDAEAQYMLGIRYYNGIGVAKDQAQAVSWWRKAAAQGDTNAQFNLGFCYTYGEGVAKDHVEAAKWYRKAADQGHTKAQDKLGYCYAAGEGVEKNEAQALKWFRKASHGYAVHTSAEALKFFRKAAEGGNAEAQYEMGLACDDNLDSAFDRTESIKWFRKAAEQGHPESQCYVGKWYLGENGGVGGVERDEIEAVKWLRKAAGQGNQEARLELSRCDESIAGTLALRMRAMHGDAEAQYELALCYYKGDGAHPDRVEALAFWILVGTTDKTGKWGTFARQTYIRFCKAKHGDFSEEPMKPDAIAKSEQRAKELQKEVEANIAAKKAGK